MKDNPKKKKIVWQQYIAIAFYLLIGVICGLLIVKYIDTTSNLKRNPGKEMLLLAVLLFGMYIAIFLQMIIHEAGHLVFGLLTGYSFSSFRIASFMWVKQNEKLCFKRFSLAGTGGQCLMAPPEIVNGKIPVVLYNLGGSLMNLITGIIFLGLYFLLNRLSFISTFMLILSVIGFIFAIMNGVPMRMGMVDNDGYNAFSLSKNHEALRSFWIQLKMNAQITKGIRLKDMPEEWFSVPEDKEMKNSIVAAIGVLSCNRLMDAHEFSKADMLMSHLLEADTAMVGLQRNMLVCDCIYCELIAENRQEKLDQMINKEFKKFMKAMKKHPSILRTEYTYALLAERDNAKAEEIKVQFEKNAKNYPYQSEIDSELELIEIAQSINFI